MKWIYSNLNKKAFWVCLITSIALLVGSFFAPPTGEVSSSVLAGVGEIFAFATLSTVIMAIEKGADINLTHNNTTIGINNPDEKEEEKE